MGIDAELVIKYRGEKPNDEQLTRWSWDLCRAVGAKHFFTGDGLPAGEYHKANRAWHAAFNAHPLYAEYSAARDNRDKWEPLRQRIVADIGESPSMLRRAIEFCGYSSLGYADDEAEAADALRNMGARYTQDGPDVLAAPGEYLLTVSLWSRYYGKSYERGDLLTICAVAEWIEANMQPCEVWYGGDSSGVCIEPFGDPARRELRRHLYSQMGRAYYMFGGRKTPAVAPKPCGLCIPGEPRFNQCGWGPNFASVHCQGCDKTFESKDNGATWTERKTD
jgi:hypothetical protein